MSRRTSAVPSSTRGRSNLAATTRDRSSGTPLPATARERGVGTPGSFGEEIDQPPARARLAVAAVTIVVRSSRDGAGGSFGADGGAAKAAARSRFGAPVCTTRPASVQPASVAPGRMLPAAISSVIRQASSRSTSTTSTEASTTSSSSEGEDPARAAAAIHGARRSSIPLPPRRTSTSASPPTSRTVPRSLRSTSNLSRPRSTIIRRAAATGRPPRSTSITSRYSTAPNQFQVAARLEIPPSMPASAIASGQSRSGVFTTAAGANQTAAPIAARTTAQRRARRPRGRPSASCARVFRVAMGRSIEVRP